MAGIQQNFQKLLKEINDRHLLWASIKEMARIAGVNSNGSLIGNPTRLQNIPITELSPRHVCFREFDVALRLLHEIGLLEEKSKQYPDISGILQEIKTSLESQVQQELSRYRGKFLKGYETLCRRTVIPQCLSAVNVNDIQREFSLPYIDKERIKSLQKTMALLRYPVSGLEEFKETKSLDDQHLPTLAQAGDQTAIKELYSDSTLRTAGCYLVQAISASSLRALKNALECLDFATLTRSQLDLLLASAFVVFFHSTIEDKTVEKQLLYNKIAMLAKPEIFLFSLLTIEIIFLMAPVECLKRQYLNLYKVPYNFDNGIIFTSSYLTQLAGISLHDFFNDRKNCKALCQDLRLLQQDIRGKEDTFPYYYLTPQEVLNLRPSDVLEVAKLPRSPPMEVASGRSCLIM